MKGRPASSQYRLRYRRIMAFFIRATLEFILYELVLARIGFRPFVRRSRSARYQRVAARFRELAIRMGGVMIKVGQFLSSRLDVLPPEITRELSGLQDEVPPERFEDIRTLAEAELGASLDEIFASFDPTPLAAASLGQVHRACLRQADATGGFAAVVVKVQRPHIDRLIEVDLSALRKFGGWLQRYKPVSRRVDVPDLVEEFSRSTRAEVDYLAEGSNAETFTANFQEDPRVHVPRVVWSHTTRRVLTLEDVFSIKITDYEAITRAGIDRAEVASVLLDIYLKQIFEDGFFHADPHPGNLFVTPIAAGSALTWKLTFVDFGMVGHVPGNLRQALRELLISVGTRDAARLVRAYQSLDILLPGADLAMIEQAESELFDLFWGKSMSELRRIDHAQMFKYAEKFRSLVYEMPFQVPQDLLMLVRAVAILSGMCTGLNKEFNLWNHIAPYAARLVSEEAGSNWKVWLDEIGALLKEWIALPSQAGRVLARLERGELTVRNPSADLHAASLARALNRLAASVIFAALFLGGLVLRLSGEQGLSLALLGCSFVVLLWLLFFLGRGPGRLHP